jgi:hypothetical protein
VKLIVCSALPTSRIFGEKVDAWWYAHNGFDVEFWDLAPLFFAREKLEGFYSASDNYRYQGPQHRILSDPDELAEAVRANSTALFWYLSRFDRMLDDDRLMDLFNRHRVRYVFQHFDPHEPAMAWPDCVKQPLRKLRERWYARLCRPVAVVTSGTVGRKQVAARYPAARVISIPSVKVLWEEDTTAVQVPYAVFVDESIAFDPDVQLHGNVLCTDVDSYYRRMRDLFRRVEDSLQMPVKVGCSGKYRYPDATRYFGEREVAYGDTLRLVQGCALAFGHLSLALDQAIVSRKPVVLVDDVSFTPWRRMGFRDVIRRFRQHPVRNTEIGNDLLQTALAKDLAFYETVEHRYFREPAVRGPYRRICADSFRTIAA